MKALQIGMAVVFVTGLVFAQTPSVAAVVRAADFQPGIPPDDYGTAYGTGLADATYQASSVPWPTKLGSTEVFGCPSGFPPPAGSLPTGCQSFPVFFASAGQVNFYVPASATGPCLYILVNDVVATPGCVSYTTLTEIQGVPVAPAIFIEVRLLHRFPLPEGRAAELRAIMDARNGGKLRALV